MPLSRQLIIFITILLIAIIGLWINGPIHQDPSYHHFADIHTILEIPNFWNVISNIPFIFLGIIFLKKSKNQALSFGRTSLLLGFLLTGIGSGYYHYNPNNETLFWDRLPMTIVFMSLFYKTIQLILTPKANVFLLLILLFLGILSVLTWGSQDFFFSGDLRFYALIQFFPMVIIPILLVINWKKFEAKKEYFLVFTFYLIAKLFEIQSIDHLIHDLTNFIGGHPLKHISASFACFYIYKWINKQEDANRRKVFD